MNIGPIVQALLKKRQELDELYADMTAFNAPGECFRHIHEAYWAEVRWIYVTHFMTVTGLKDYLRERGISEKWIHFSGLGEMLSYDGEFYP